MNVFEFRDKLVSEYAEYVGSFINIHDRRISEKVQAELSAGLLWPDPLIQLNPSFEPGETIDDLVKQQLLHARCREVFRRKPRPTDYGEPMRLHRHQSDAIRAARSGGSYVLTTGTGSGKSLAYIVPIVDYVLLNGPGKGIQAIIVYPMNALANSQEGELTKFLCHGFPDLKGPVTFAKYTGQEPDERRNEIISKPPDILLTNYVMLELILTRLDEQQLVSAAKGLRFLVLDELHTYRGRQGADVAMLVRRVREATAAQHLQCIGTSATLAGEGAYAEQQAAVAAMATRLFGSEVIPANVIGETLRRVTPEPNVDGAGYVEALTRRIADVGLKTPTDFQNLVSDPLCAWIESTFGVTAEPESGRLIRSRPRSITGKEGAAGELAALVRVDEGRCRAAIEEALLAGYECPHPETEFPVFAFRLHQFISRGDNVYTSLEPEDARHITAHGQQFVPGDRGRVLLPMVFCRECGQEYYCVRKGSDGQGTGVVLRARELQDRSQNDEGEPGFLYYSTEMPWPTEVAEINQRVPGDYLETHKGELRIRPSQRRYVPTDLSVAPDGSVSAEGLVFQWLPAPFRFCLRCGVSYSARQQTDFGKLTSLSSEGRSTATTILSLAAVRYLKQAEGLGPKARKLLSFTDNRQDAALQAGHFNDFVEVGLLRGALYQACLNAGPEGIQHEQITHRVAEALDLPKEEYAADPTVKYAAEAQTRAAMREVIGYRLYRDLERGWRVTAPNLEQCGLLEMHYLSLDELSADDEAWTSWNNGKSKVATHAALAGATPEVRQAVCKTLLDHMRRQLAVRVSYLNADSQDSLRQTSSQRLREPWALDENEKLEHWSVLYPRAYREGQDYGGDVFLSPRGAFGQYVRRKAFPTYQGQLTLDDVEAICRQLMAILRTAGLVEEVAQPRSPDDPPGYQLPAASMVWVAGDGTQPCPDPMRMPNLPTEGLRANPFFVQFYKATARESLGIRAKEHTAQVPYEDRQEREELFREAKLPILFCSPTMELGVDIADLNAVNMRNVPPTPANYAQRSGRAGRSGQPALVFTYCTTGSSHDQYFFRSPGYMVAGAVTPPRLDLANEDLIRAHVHAVWLAESKVPLGRSLVEVLDVAGEKPSLDLLESVRIAVDAPTARVKAKVSAARVLDTISEELSGADWFSPGWLDEVMDHIPLEFERACERWCGLYRSAMAQREAQHRISLDLSRPQKDRDLAKRLRQEAETQVELLTSADNIMQSDFYSYRYFASEGFLPGYNFPRLPISAYIPGRRQTRGRDEFIQRPRFLAISEFGPRAVIYHEGSRYLIHRVMLPVSDATGAAGEKGLLSVGAKRCPACGYIHPIIDGVGADVCENCDTKLDRVLAPLFRLQNVFTRRRERINSDEEERLRLGYEVRSGIRFALPGGQPSRRLAEVRVEDSTVAVLTYGHAATIWRVNQGWTRRANKNVLGFVLDLERGYWERGDHETPEDADPMSPQKRRVIPYVEDRRNCLLLAPADGLSVEAMASLQAALKAATEVSYQLEDRELAVEPLPDPSDRRVVLFYEAAEGGAGVLRSLIDDPHALGRVARKALELCHFDPSTGTDLRRSPKAAEDCEAACYNCLMNYYNQRDHEVLDRKAIRDILMSYASAVVVSSPTAAPRAEHLDHLRNLCMSDLEREWLQFLQDRGLRLPSAAQKLVEACGTRPDFLYEAEQVAIYVDGPPHDASDRQARDATQQECLEDLGYTVLRFRCQDDWASTVGRFGNVFGVTP